MLVSSKLTNKRVMMDEDRVITSNKFIEAVYKIDLREKKILTAMINTVQKIGDRATYECSAMDLARSAGIDTSSVYRDIRNIMDKLTDIKIKIINDQEEYFEFFRFVDNAKYNEGLLNFKLSDEFKECIFKLERQFTKYLMKNVRPMKSVYSIRLYELLKQYESIGSRSFEIKELITLLQSPEYRYSLLDHNVLKKAKEEINTHSDIKISYKPKRKGRAYQSIEFIIEINQSKEGMEEVELPNMPENPLEYIKFEKELNSNGVKLNILKKVVIKHHLNWDHMIVFWKEVLKEKSKHKPLKTRGKYIKDCYDPDNDLCQDFMNMHVELTIKEIPKM